MPDIDHWGKIVCHFPDRGNPNLDVMDIKFLAHGASSLSHIDRVYMIPPGVTVSTPEDLQQYIVWTTDLTLQQLGEPITIEYVPPDDMNLTDIAIFTTDNEQSQTINFAIFHESGLVVAKSNGDTSTATTFFGTSGYRRNTTVSGVTLKKGYKYYIQYTNANNTFKPAAMDGWVGNYLKWTHGQAQNRNVANINSTTGYQRSVTDIADFVAVPTGNFFKWSGNTYGTQSNRIYVRNNVGHGVYAGSIGSGNLSVNDMDTILKYGENTMYLWTGYTIDNGNTMVQNNFHVRNSSLATSHYKGIVQDRAQLIDPSYDIDDYVIRDNYGQVNIYQKTGNPTVFSIMNFSEYSEYSNAVQAATLIKKSSPSPSPSGPNGDVMTFGQFYNANKNGYIYTLQSGKTYDFILVNNVLSGYTVANPPASYVTGCIYYMEENGQYNNIYANVGLNLWTGSGWTGVAQYNDNLDVVFDIITNAAEQYTTEVSRSTPIDIVGDATALVSASYDNTYQSETLPSQQVWSDQKYYLKLNDTEV